MLLDPDHCYQALAAHDPRFDGLFYVGVATTGIYCRPVCPARTPRRDRCRFFGNPASAEKAGFRPCRRCRPELAPGSARVDAVSRIAAAAARRIEDGALDDGDLESLARELGVSSRQVRRAMEQELGVSPVEYAQTQRLLMAKRLLSDSTLPVTEVAFAAGFASVRRFNALFRERYRMSPTELRRTNGGAQPDGVLRFELAYRPPIAWAALVGYLGGRGYAVAEAVDGNRYLRTVRLGEHRGWLTVAPTAGKNAVRVELAPSLARVVGPVLARVRRLLDLDAQPDRVAAHFSGDPVLSPLVERHPGLRIPGCFDGFELALRAVLGQQISVAGATRLAGKFAEGFGEPAPDAPVPLLRFAPTAERIAAAPIEEIAALGVPRSRAACIRGLAEAIAAGKLRLEPGTNPETVMAQMVELPGIGEWTAQYVALRALRWPDAFPHTDLGLRQALEMAPPREPLERAEAWRPWRGYAAVYLWKSLEKNP
jgi:AraC family transcriptional regulator of adaptative response / DNA-3-methyladenine glycosylase II